MDATDLIRQAQNSVKRAREKNLIPETSQFNDNYPSTKIYTLAACCRCRQARNLHRSLLDLSTDFE